MLHAHGAELCSPRSFMFEHLQTGSAVLRFASSACAQAQPPAHAHSHAHSSHQFADPCSCSMPSCMARACKAELAQPALARAAFRSLSPSACAFAQPRAHAHPHAHKCAMSLCVLHACEAGCTRPLSLSRRHAQSSSAVLVLAWTARASAQPHAHMRIRMHIRMYIKCPSIEPEAIDLGTCNMPSCIAHAREAAHSSPLSCASFTHVASGPCALWLPLRFARSPRAQCD